MDLDDWGGADAEAGAPSQAPPRRAKFAPKSFKFKPKTEQQQPEPAPKPSEPENLYASIPKEEEPMEDVKPTINVEEEVKPTINVIPKAEPSVSNGAVENEHENKPHDAMEVDKEVEEDMVVREIDVFFTPSIDANTKLYLMQYPLRPCWRPYELEERCQEVRVKPGCPEVEIDMSIDVSTNWDAKIAERLEMTKQTLLSSSTSPHVYDHAVGILVGNKLHLNPIHAVVQLQPSMDYLSSTGARRTNQATIVADQAVKLEDSNEGKPVGASRKQNKGMESGNEQKLESQEFWIPLKYHDSKSDFSSEYLQKMVAQEDSSIDFKMSPYDYMSALCPATTNNSIKPKGPSKKVLLSMPLEERMKKLLLEGPPVQRFGVLKHFAPDDSVEDVLKVLDKHGILVHGLWAPRSNLMFPNEGQKQAARDIVLHLFSKDVVVSMSEINPPPKIKEDVKIFLNTYAIERPSDWKFKEQADPSFVKLYPDIVQQQKQSWEVLGDKLKPLMNKKVTSGMKRGTMKSYAVDDPVKSLNSLKGTTKAGSGALSKKTTMTNETREALRKVLPKVFQNRKVCSFELICQGLRDLAVSQSSLPKVDPRVVVAAASGAEAPPEELQEVIGEVATKIHGLYVLKSSPDHPELDPLRRAVIGLLQVRGPNAKLKKAEVIEAAKPGLKRTAIPSEFQKVISDICESRGSHWVLKSGDGKPS